MSAEICRAIHLVDGDTRRVSSTRVSLCMYLARSFAIKRSGQTYPRASLCAIITAETRKREDERERGREEKRVMKREKEREKGAEDNVTLTERLMCSAAL